MNKRFRRVKNKTSDYILALWLGRLESVGKAQSRYLYLLLIFAIFLFILEYQFQTRHDFLMKPLNIPILNIYIEPILIFAFSPIIFAILEMGTIGTMRSWKTAREKIQQILPENIPSEAFDRVPNLIDFTFAKTPKTKNPLIIYLIWAKYPFVLSVFALEAFWMFHHLFEFKNIYPYKWILIIISGFFWVPVLTGLKEIWTNKMNKAKADIAKQTG